MSRRRRGPGLRDLIWGVALVIWLVLTYVNPAMPGHDGLVGGAHFYPHHLAGLLLLVIGGLGIWFGLRTRTGRLREIRSGQHINVVLPWVRRAHAATRKGRETALILSEFPPERGLRLRTIDRTLD